MYYDTHNIPYISRFETSECHDGQIAATH